MCTNYLCVKVNEFENLNKLIIIHQKKGIVYAIEKKGISNNLISFSKSAIIAILCCHICLPINSPTNKWNIMQITSTNNKQKERVNYLRIAKHSRQFYFLPSKHNLD